jgi:phosphoribosylglycinamide formyltransferase-1
VVLAGFLKLVPNSFIAQSPNEIINIHPALLPKYGGKGMYGMHVHNAVIQAKELESGITIHYVNGLYDEGQIIKQFRVAMSENETPQSLSAKVRALEHKYFSDTVAKLITSNKN